MFADQYIQKNIVYPQFIESVVSKQLSMIVMIPCLNEPGILRTLESLWACDPSDTALEVIVAVNNSENCSPEVKMFNQQTFEQLLAWKKENDRPEMILNPIFAPAVNAKDAGAGMARKIGMDEAVRRFNRINCPAGVIISLDADCLVSPNYLRRIETVFAGNKSCFAATINFRHRIDELDDPKLKRGIQLYEDYLHYYKNALCYTGFPNAIYTIGSAFAVRADAYVKQGGMNRRKAGEDFYFLHKLTHLGKLYEIQDAFVYPSGRVSDRVPFGTGAALTKWMNDKDDLTVTYNFNAFMDMKLLFEKVSSFYNSGSTGYSKVINGLPLTIQEYFEINSIERRVAEINRNSSSAESFSKRFFQVFDGLMILRFLNQVHENHYSFQDLQEAIDQLRLAGR
jgi:glycosyltransferase involved in cell wall biosynthesis